MERAPRPCAQPGCDQITFTGRCPAHTRNQRAAPYNGAWRQLSRDWLSQHPRCVLCGQSASETDHVRMINAGGAWLDRRFLRSLCGACHRRITAEQTRPRHVKLR